MTDYKDAALEPFLRAARAIPEHFRGDVPLKAQVLKGLRLPTVDEYRALLRAFPNGVEQ